MFLKRADDVTRNARKHLPEPVAGGREKVVGVYEGERGTSWRRLGLVRHPVSPYTAICPKDRKREGLSSHRKQEISGAATPEIGMRQCGGIVTFFSVPVRPHT